MESIRKATLEMHTLLLCADVQFLGITRTVLNQLQVTPKIVGHCDGALEMIQQYEFDVTLWIGGRSKVSETSFVPFVNQS